ncbi:hypothetical protein PNEG_01256 [Pneumocystis murina B123]|uniref:DMAP1-binding domain-containing protein n=1 Tax=Pneumocystis murina (strain B123) TaxID=1069680 RepID=M7P9K3_PNEMU|nr:hypothetical protein PNEG_01256 [Pneumocystis murina B123]EMR10550.1 hypothetical protein PNEG_01256 [Pneumocystis murina B123]
MPIQYKEKDEMSVFSGKSDISRVILRELQSIKKELDDGEITKKGYEKRRKEILLKYKDNMDSNEDSLNINKEVFGNQNTNGNYDFELKNMPYDKNSDHTKSNNDQTFYNHEYLMEDSYNYKNNRSSDEQSNSISNKKLPESLIEQVGKQQLPFKPRGIPFSAYDRHDPRFLTTKFDNIASVFRYRSKMASKKKAIIVSDNKGREMNNITYNKLLTRTEKVAQAIKSKPEFQRGSRVILIYNNFEIIDFVVSLFACFIAGVIAVPVNNYKDITELYEILISTQSRLILTTHINLKNLQKRLIDRKLQLPYVIEWWETNNFGGFYSKKKHSSAPLQTHDLAYIEYSRSPTGELRGVVIPHSTIVNQMISLSTTISSTPKNIKKQMSNKNSSKKHSTTEDSEVFITYLDQRQAIGLIFTIFFSIYSGSTTVWCSQKAVSVPGLWANLITKYRATMILANYPGLKTVTYNYQDDPMQTRKFKKKYPIDFSSIRLCLIDCVCVDPEFHEILADRWLRPLGNSRPWEVLSPILCLPEHGGMVISMRDWLGREQQMLSDFTDNHNISTNNELAQVLLDKEALKTNKVVILSEEKNIKGKYDDLDAVTVGSFWYPIADTTLAIVDPETSIFCNSNVIGEIWVDSPSLSGGFWNSPQQTKSLFHAKAYMIDAETSKQVVYNQEFLRTGLLGCMIKGRIYVLGLYEDRLRQRIVSIQNKDAIEYRYHYVSHLVQTIMRNVPHVFDCTSFDIFINGEYYPIVVLEFPASIITPDPSEQSNTSNHNILDAITQKCKKALLNSHNIKVYCIMMALSNTLPRVNKNGHKEISNMLCRKGFELGTLPCEHVKFLINEVTLDLPVGEDPIGGIWSKVATQKRQELLCSEKKQYSVGDERTLSMDDQTLINLFAYGSIIDVLQWRVASQSDELALSVIDSKGRDRGVTWKKLDLKIANVANYLKFKIKLQSGDHAILMYTQSDDFLYAIHACFCLGIIAIPIPPLNTSRLSEDIPSFLGVISDFKIKAVLVNNETDSTFKSKLFSYNIKRYTSIAKIVLPNIINTSKSPKQTLGCIESGFMLDQEWIDLKVPALIWLYWSPDRRRTAVELGHETIMSCCRIQKETCQMSSSRPLLGCMQGTSGIGFLHSYILGIYIGATTYLVSPRDFIANPLILFDSIAKFKVKDTYIAPEALSDAIEAIQTKDTCLHELRNLMITFNSRPQFDYFQRVKSDFSESILDPNSLSNVYCNVLNPMITTRSYMSIEPIHLYLNIKSLRQGIIEPIDMIHDPFALLLYDSGMVPVSTHIAIVNPETCDLCSEGEYGEIWVASDANMKSFYGSKNKIDLERFRGILTNNNRKDIYVRTGDLGFLYNVQRPVGPEGLLIEMQSLFILGSIGDTFEVNGLLHFPIDIESSVEKSHNNILPGGSAVFQTGSSIIILIEVKHKSNLPSIVPVVVNTVLNKHQIIIDTVVFTAKGNFPRSRVGEKQRGKILELWLTKKLELLGEFVIRERQNIIPQTLNSRKNSKVNSISSHKT